jgi:hypothetical protein
LFPGDSTLLNYFHGRERIAGAQTSASIDTVILVAIFVIVTIFVITTGKIPECTTILP